MAGAFGSRDGRLFFTAIGLWAVARAVVSTTWRDPVVAGGLNAGGLIAVGIAIALRRRARGPDGPSPRPARRMPTRDPADPADAADPTRRRRLARSARPARGSDPGDPTPPRTTSEYRGTLHARGRAR